MEYGDIKYFFSHDDFVLLIWSISVLKLIKYDKEIFIEQHSLD